MLTHAARLDAPATLGRDLDAVDVLVLNALGELSGAAAIRLRDLDGDPVAMLSASMTAGWAGRNAEQAEQALLGVLAPRLVARLVQTCGEDWRAEAETVVDLVLASRLEELPSLALAMRAGGVGVDRSDAIDLFAATVQNPQAVWLV